MNNEDRHGLADTDTVSPVDFSKYQTEELARRVFELIGVPGALVHVARSTVLVTVFVLVTCVAIDVFTELSLLTQATIYFYSLVAGAVIGFLLGLLQVVVAALGHVEEILNITLEITGQVSRDIGLVRSGQSRLPGGGELLHQVYGDVLLPVLESVISESFGSLARPVLFVYRWTLGNAVARLIRMVPPSQDTPQEASEMTETVRGTMELVNSNHKEIQKYVGRASAMVAGVSRRLRGYVVTPLWCAFLVLAALALFPWIGILYLNAN